MVRLPILTLSLLLASPAMAASEVPRIDIQKVCRTAAKLETVDQSTFQACVGEETQAREQLEKQWASFTASHRSICVQETNIGGDPSYVEVLTCLQMYQDASTPPPAPPPGATPPPAPPPGGQTSK